MSEFEVLKASHRFLRADGQTAQSWEDKVAQKYEESLFREFAMCDLKHYKSGQFALRWRTEDEVVSGAGQDTCANTRCGAAQSTSASKLQTLELPFNYVERGEQQSALVKVVLCDRCVHKLMWKRNHDKAERLRREQEVAEDKLALQLAAPTPAQDPRRDSVTHETGRRARDERSASPARRRERDESHRRRHSRSRSRSRSPSHRKYRSRREDGKQRDEASRRRVKIESPS